MMPMRRNLKAGNFCFDPVEIERLQKEVDVPLTMEDFVEALKNI